MKIEVNTASSKQEAIPEIGRESKTLYYLIIGEGKEQVYINIGEKTYKGVVKLLIEKQTGKIGK
nr:MAG: hypothetical protein [Microviridae sp.]